MKNLQKGFVVPLLLGIIALLVIGGGVYIYQNKKAEVPSTNTNTEVNSENVTSNWKTYTNTKYGFEFQYPPTYTAKTENDSRNTIVFASDELTFGVFIPIESEKMGFLANGIGNEYDLRFSGHGILFRQILSTFKFTR